MLRLSREIKADPGEGFVPEAGEREASHDGREKNKKGEERQDEVIGSLCRQAGDVIGIYLFPNSIYQLFDRHTAFGELPDGDAVFTFPYLRTGRAVIFAPVRRTVCTPRKPHPNLHFGSALQAFFLVRASGIPKLVS